MSAAAGRPWWRRIRPAGPLSLRARLLGASLILVLLGLTAADVATYTALRSFLLGRVDQQLDATHQTVEHAVGEAMANPDDPNAAAAIRSLGQVAPGFYVQLRDASNHVVATIQSRGPDQPTSVPRLPDTLPAVSRGDRSDGSPAEPAKLLTVPAAQHGGPSFRARVSPLPFAGGTLVVALPLGALTATLHQLVVIEVLVTLGVLIAAALVGLWLVRLGLRPLDDIGATAGMIAGGDLTQRVERADRGTEVGRLGYALNQMLEQIEAAFAQRRASEERLRRFAADASHELRTPLAAIRGYAELFRRGADRHPEDLARVLRRIEGETVRMGGLVEDLLLLTRLDQGRPLEQRAVDLGAVATEAVEAARAVEPGRPIQLDVRGLVEVLGDHDRLRQAADNLLANVRAHTPAGAPARVSVDVEPGAGGAQAVLQVADQGQGLTAEQAAHVFERFYRVDSSRSRSPSRDGGSGLGLAIVSAIASAHGGRASVRSVPGQGSAFRLELPLLAPAAPAPDRPSLEPPERQGSQTPAAGRG